MKINNSTQFTAKRCKNTRWIFFTAFITAFVTKIHRRTSTRVLLPALSRFIFPYLNRLRSLGDPRQTSHRQHFGDQRRAAYNPPPPQPSTGYRTPGIHSGVQSGVRGGIRGGIQGGFYGIYDTEPSPYTNFGSPTGSDDTVSLASTLSAGTNESGGHQPMPIPGGGARVNRAMIDSQVDNFSIRSGSSSGSSEGGSPFKYFPSYDLYRTSPKSPGANNVSQLYRCSNLAT